MFLSQIGIEDVLILPLGMNRIHRLRTNDRLLHLLIYTSSLTSVPSLLNSSPLLVAIDFVDFCEQRLYGYWFIESEHVGSEELRLIRTTNRGHIIISIMDWATGKMTLVGDILISFCTCSPLQSNCLIMCTLQLKVETSDFEIFLFGGLPHTTDA